MRRILVVLAMIALMTVGCGDDTDTPAGPAPEPATTEAPAETATLGVTSIDFGYELASTEVPAGRVEVVQTNEGDVEHQATIIRLDDGQTPQDLVDLITAETDSALDPAAFAGGPNTIAPGESNTAVVDLTAGEYVTYCFIPQHAQDGMVAPFTVTGEVPEAEPTSSIELLDFGFGVPEDFDGQGRVEVVNTGDAPHELTITSGDQVPESGFATTGPGTTGYIDLDLAPGDYTFVCFVRDPDSGQLHFQLGMEQTVTIS